MHTNPAQGAKGGGEREVIHLSIHPFRQDAFFQTRSKTKYARTYFQTRHVLSQVVHSCKRMCLCKTEERKEKARIRVHSLPRYFDIFDGLLEKWSQPPGSSILSSCPRAKSQKGLSQNYEYCASCILCHVLCVVRKPTVTFSSAKADSHAASFIFASRFGSRSQSLSSRHRAYLEAFLLWLRNGNVLVIPPTNMDMGTNMDTPSRNSYLDHVGPFSSPI